MQVDTNDCEMERLVARKGYSLEVASSSLAFATMFIEGVGNVPADQDSD